MKKKNTKDRSVTISLIAAVDKKRGIGKDNRLPWNIPEDIKRFTKITLGYPIIMGRKTFESIGKALPGRINIVITRNKKYKALGCLLSHSLENALELAQKKKKREIFIIGGGEIYKQAISLADKLYLTLVEGNYEADTFFPDYSKFSKIVSKKKSRSKDHQYTFLELERSK